MIMKYFKFLPRFLPIVLVIFSSSFSTVFATPITAETNDMLQGNDNENENADAASKWGKSGSQARANSVPVAKPLSAIDESSFARESNRAPASMRAPAEVKPVVVSAPKPLPSEKTMVRTLAQKKAYQEAAVIVNDLGFFPSTLFVTQGVPVRLYVTGASQRSQCIILDAFGVRRQIRNQKVEEVIFTPDQAGRFSYSCPMNGAKGTIIVRELEVARLPAAEPIQTAASSVKKPAQPEKDEADDISEDDFGVEFREKP